LNNDAGKNWYSGELYYNFNTGDLPKDKDEKKAVEKFSKMVWKNTKKVGFGVKGKWVIAWYCDAKPNKGSFVQNIGDHCMVSAKYNKCFVKMALTQHNKYRALHGANSLI